jgi:hypothetical protein
MRVSIARLFFSNLPRVERERKLREFWFSVVVAVLACVTVALMLWLGYYKARM